MWWLVVFVYLVGPQSSTEFGIGPMRTEAQCQKVMESFAASYWRDKDTPATEGFEITGFDCRHQ